MESTLKIIAENFEFVYDSKKNNKRMLRFTRTWSIQHPIAGEIGDSIEGCLAQKDYKGDVYWNPPLNYMRGKNGRKQLHHMSPAMYKGVLEALKKSKYCDKLEIPMQLVKKERAVDIDPELPESVEVDFNLDESQLD